MYSPSSTTNPHRFVARPFSAAIHPHCFLLMALILLAELAWVKPVAMAQTVTFTGQQATVSAGVLNQPDSVAMEGAGSATAVPGSRLSAEAITAGDSLMADVGTPSLGNFPLNFDDGGLPLTKGSPTPGPMSQRTPVLSATLLDARSAFLGRPASVMILGANAQPQRRQGTHASGLPTTRYWTLRRKIETASVTLLHMADAAQTCWHEANTPRWHEQNPMTPKTCQGASVALVGSGPLLQWASYRLTQRYPRSRLWAHIDHILPQIEISVSVMSIRCSQTENCNGYGF